MSWPFLIYLIDVLSTDGKYEGWGFLLFLCVIVYMLMRILPKILEEPKMDIYPGQNLVLAQDWSRFKAGDVLVVKDTVGGDVLLRHGEESLGSWVSKSILRKVCKLDEKQEYIPQQDAMETPRKLTVIAMAVCVIGILYANFMPQKETSYKMLAAYVGQNIVESPRTQQLADSTIKYLDAQIKKYTQELGDSSEVASKESKPGEKVKE